MQTSKNELEQELKLHMREWETKTHQLEEARTEFENWGISNDFSLWYVVSKGEKENMNSVLFLNALNNKKISNYR